MTVPTLITQLHAVLDLTNTEIQVAETRVTQRARRPCAEN